MAKIVDNYRNFDIKILITEEFIVRPDRDLKEYVPSFKMGPYNTLELARAGIDRYWGE